MVIFPDSPIFMHGRGAFLRAERVLTGHEDAHCCLHLDGLHFETSIFTLFSGGTTRVMGGGNGGGNCASLEVGASICSSICFSSAVYFVSFRSMWFFCFSPCDGFLMMWSIFFLNRMEREILKGHQPEGGKKEENETTCRPYFQSRLRGICWT